MASQQGSSKKLRRSTPHHIKGPNKVKKGMMYKQNGDKNRFPLCSKVEAMTMAKILRKNGIVMTDKWIIGTKE
jgi:hypothetical protein